MEDFLKVMSENKVSIWSNMQYIGLTPSRAILPLKLQCCTIHIIDNGKTVHHPLQMTFKSKNLTRAPAIFLSMVTHCF